MKRLKDSIWWHARPLKATQDSRHRAASAWVRRSKDNESGIVRSVEKQTERAVRNLNITVDNLLFMIKKYKILKRLNATGNILILCLSSNSDLRVTSDSTIYLSQMLQASKTDGFFIGAPFAMRSKKRFHPRSTFTRTYIMIVTAVQPNKCRFFLKILGFTIFFSSAGFSAAGFLFKLVGMRDANL